MSIAESVTKLPLATFAKIIGFHPVHFEQVRFTPTNRSPSICKQAMFQYTWQENDRISREEIAMAIHEAETMMERYLSYRLVPSWEIDEWTPVARPNQPELVGYTNIDIRRYPTAIEAKWGHFVMPGIQAKTLVAAAQVIVWSDADGDGIKETGTVGPIPMPAGAQACEIEVYYPGKFGADRYQIRPITIAVAAGNAVITFKRELTVIESILEAIEPDAADYDQDADFLPNVDVYRRYNDPSTQVTLMWEPAGCPACDGTGCVSCSYAVQTACLYAKSKKYSQLGYRTANWDAATSSFIPVDCVTNRTPDIARLYYLAGYSTPTGCPRVMDSNLARAVAYLATSLMDRALCDCSAKIWEYWREDLALANGADQFRTYNNSSIRGIDNPFGTRRGAVYAWQRVTDPELGLVRSAVLV